MTALIQDLRGVFARHIEQATAADIIAIASTLCGAQQTARDGDQVAPVASPSRFEVSGDLVTDRQTGLVWTRGNARTDRLDWKDAKQACVDLKAGGFSDWRLPTIRELLSVVDYERRNPAIDPVFACEAEGYWTSTPAKYSPDDYAWIVGFGDGGSGWGVQDGEYFVRAVRAGQLIRTLG